MILTINRIEWSDGKTKVKNKEPDIIYSVGILVKQVPC